MNNFTVLLIDDIEENIFALKLLIEDQFSNINILTALNSQHALLQIMKHEVDLILSDVQMPDIDGFELIEYLHNIEQTKDIPIILISAIYNDDRYAKKAYGMGAIEYISKPIDNELLCSKLRVYIDIFAQKKESSHLLEEKDKMLLSQLKINSMIENIEHLPPEIQDSFQEQETEGKGSVPIDIAAILKNI